MSSSGTTMATVIARNTILATNSALCLRRTNEVAWNTGVLSPSYRKRHRDRIPRTTRSAVRLTTNVMVNSRIPMMNNTW